MELQIFEPISRQHGFVASHRFEEGAPGTSEAKLPRRPRNTNSPTSDGFQQLQHLRVGKPEAINAETGETFHKEFASYRLFSGESADLDPT